MKPLVNTRVPLMTLAIMGSLLIAVAAAAAPIAKLSGVQGDVTVLLFEERKLVVVTQPGLALSDGDHLQTGRGTATVTFNDGAVVEVNPFSSTKIQEYEESSGLWPFGVKRAVRRVTVFVGKLFFKSGSSKVKNYLQTPTAVCALRGSEGWIGYDTLKTYLDMAAEQIETLSEDVAQGAIGEILDAFAQSDVYQSGQKAKESGNLADILMALDTGLGAIEGNPYLEEAAREVIRRARQKIQEELAALGLVTTTAPASTTTSTTSTTTTTFTTTSTSTSTTAAPPTTTTTTTTTTTQRRPTTTTTSTSTTTSTTTTTTTTTSTTEHIGPTSTMSEYWPSTTYNGNGYYNGY